MNRIYDVFNAIMTDIAVGINAKMVNNAILLRKSENMRFHTDRIKVASLGLDARYMPPHANFYLPHQRQIMWFPATALFNEALTLPWRGAWAHCPRPTQDNRYNVGAAPNQHLQ